MLLVGVNILKLLGITRHIPEGSKKWDIDGQIFKQGYNVLKHVTLLFIM